MIDFKKMDREADAKRTPEHRAKIAWRHIEESSDHCSRKPITATFERLSRVRFGSDEDAAIEIKHIPVTRRFQGVEVLAAIPEQPLEGRIVEIHRLSDSSYYAELIAEGYAEDAEFAVDVTDRRPLVAFENAVTGYEQFALDDRFIRGAIEVADNNEGEFYICAGRKGDYDSCRVRASEVLDWLRTLDDVDPDVAALLTATETSAPRV